MSNKYESSGSKKDFVWKYVKKVNGEKYMRCIFCDQVWSGGVNKLKHHLAGTHHGMRPYSKVSEDVRLECRMILLDFNDKKSKRNQLLKEICMRPNPNTNSGWNGKPVGGIKSGNSSLEPKSTRAMDRFTNSKPRQATLKCKWK